MIGDADIPARLLMSGTVEWAVLIFLGGIAAGSMTLAWAARGILARFESKYDASLAALSRDVQDRNFLVKYDLAIARLEKDLEHDKNNLKHHAVMSGEMHDDLLKVQFELARLGKLVNGK